MTSRADIPPADTPARSWAPSRHDTVVRMASQVIGGPLGRFAAVGQRGWRPAAAVLSALSSVFIALSVLQRNHCINNGWATPGSLWRYCYSDLPVAVSVPAGSTPWASSAIGGQPPLTAIVTWLVRLLVPEGSQLRLQQGMFAFGAGVIALCIAAAVCFLAASLPRGPWAAAHLALSPVLFTAALTSFDALAVLFVAVSLWAYARQRPMLAGAAAMAAALTRPMLGVVLLALLLVATSEPSKRGLGRIAGGAGLVFLLTSLAVLAGSDDPLFPLTNWEAQVASYGSTWFVFELAGARVSPTVLTLMAAMSWIAAAVIGAVLVRFERISSPAPIALLMLLAVMLFARTLPVQAALWVLPLLAACALTWRTHLIWAAGEVAYFLVVWPFVARASNAAKALPDGWYAAFVVLRLAGLVFLATMVVRESLSTDSSRHPDTGKLGGSTFAPSTPHV